MNKSAQLQREHTKTEFTPPKSKDMRMHRSLTFADESVNLRLGHTHDNSLSFPLREKLAINRPSDQSASSISIRRT